MKIDRSLRARFQGVVNKDPEDFDQALDKLGNDVKQTLATAKKDVSERRLEHPLKVARGNAQAFLDRHLDHAAVPARERDVATMLGRDIVSIQSRSMSSYCTDKLAFVLTVNKPGQSKPFTRADVEAAFHKKVDEMVNRDSKVDLVGVQDLKARDVFLTKALSEALTEMIGHQRNTLFDQRMAQKLGSLGPQMWGMPQSPVTIGERSNEKDAVQDLVGSPGFAQVYDRVRGQEELELADFRKAKVGRPAQHKLRELLIEAMRIKDQKPMPPAAPGDRDAQMVRQLADLHRRGVLGSPIKDKVFMERVAEHYARRVGEIYPIDKQGMPDLEHPHGTLYNGVFQSAVGEVMKGLQDQAADDAAPPRDAKAAGVGAGVPRS